MEGARETGDEQLQEQMGKEQCRDKKERQERIPKVEML